MRVRQPDLQLVLLLLPLLLLLQLSPTPTGSLEVFALKKNLDLICVLLLKI